MNVIPPDIVISPGKRYVIRNHGISDTNDMVFSKCIMTYFNPGHAYVFCKNCYYDSTGATNLR